MRSVQHNAALVEELIAVSKKARRSDSLPRMSSRRPVKLRPLPRGLFRRTPRNAAKSCQLQPDVQPEAV
jgi:hypothetical protein